MNSIDINDNTFDRYLFYDIEVFAEDSLVVFKDINGETLRIFHNTFEGLREFIQGKVLVGYNNYHYDDYILTLMLRPNKPDPHLLKSFNDQIIQEGTYGGVKIDSDILSLDCFQQINVAKSSLKKIEANIGLSIDESGVPFDISRKLSPEELAETIKYCEQDVNATIAVFKLRWNSYFVPKLMIIDMLPVRLQEKALRWNTTTITANILVQDGQQLEQWRDWKLGQEDSDTFRLLDLAPDGAADMWNALSRLEVVGDDLRPASETSKDKKKPIKYTHHEYGCTFEFSQGGLHGVNSSGRKKFSDVKLLDVTSLYPNILMKLKALGKSTDKYKEIVDKRVQVKHSDPILSNALKLIINSTYGLMKNQYSKLYNPMAALSVCIYGQIALYDLCGRLYRAGYALINVNTDGVAFTGSNTDTISDQEAYIEVQKEWEKDYGFSLELSEFSKWIQKDVNNYVAVDKDGHIKVKGAEVNHYYDPTDYLTDPFNLNAGVTWSGTNTKGIIHHCIVNKLVYGKDFVDTVVENLDNPILFQYVLQCGRTYIGTVDEDGNTYQKVNRVFASKDGVTLKKQKEGCNPQYFPNAPKSMYVYNGDLREFDGFKEIVDVNFYTGLAEEKYTKLWT